MFRTLIKTCLMYLCQPSVCVIADTKLPENILRKVVQDAVSWCQMSNDLLLYLQTWPILLSWVHNEVSWPHRDACKCKTLNKQSWAKKWLVNCLCLMFERVMGYSHFLEGGYYSRSTRTHCILWLSVSIVKKWQGHQFGLNSPSPPPSLTLSLLFLLHFFSLWRRTRTSRCHWDVILWGSNSFQQRTVNYIR